MRWRGSCSMSRCRRSSATSWPTSSRTPFTLRLLGHGGAEDATVWDLARTHDCLIVSKDEDFNRLAILRGAPPKFVWVRRGNCATSEIAALLRQRREEIVRFDEQDEATVLELK